MSLQQSFDEICVEARYSQEGDRVYVSLYREETTYGGPEEGGWWRNHFIYEASMRYPSEEMARSAYDRVQAHAKELNRERVRSEGARDLAVCEHAFDRGIDDIDERYGPGDTTRYVVVLEHQPGFSQHIDTSRYE